MVAKEDLKRVLAIKYKGNIYSEFSTLFCTAPYFYPELTPKLTASNSFDSRISQSFSRGAHAASVVSKNNNSSSAVSSMRSKKKFLKKYSDYSLDKKEKTADKENTNTNSNNGNNNNNKKSGYRGNSDAESLSDQDIDDENDEDDDENSNDDRLHLCICVHGLDGNSGDLRLIRTYLELALPGAKLDFLMSEHNQENTFDDIEVMTVQLIKEINDHIESYGIDPYRISFIGRKIWLIIIDRLADSLSDRKNSLLPEKV